LSIIRKALVFSRTDGLANTTRYACQAVRNMFGLRTSVTLFMRCMFSERQQILPSDEVPELERIDGSNVLRKYTCERLEFVPFDRWLNSGSICYIHRSHNSIVGYCWAHPSTYRVSRRLGQFTLKDHEAWIGPIFIDKRYRGQGIAGPLVNFALADQMHTGMTTFYTSLNSGNTVSQRLFAKHGFEIIGSTHVQGFGRYQFKRIKLDLNSQDILRERLT